MGTKLTTPITRPAITSQAIQAFTVTVPHVLDDATGDYVINRDNIRLEYQVSTVNADGESINLEVRSALFADFPPVLITTLRDLYKLLETDARNQGLIGDGTDEDI